MEILIELLTNPAFWTLALASLVPALSKTVGGERMATLKAIGRAAASGASKMKKGIVPALVCASLVLCLGFPTVATAEGLVDDGSLDLYLAKLGRTTEFTVLPGALTLGVDFFRDGSWIDFSPTKVNPIGLACEIPKVGGFLPWCFVDAIVETATAHASP